MQRSAAPEAKTTPAESMNKSLEILRGLAAFLVVASHSRLYPYTEAGVPLIGSTLLEKLSLVPTAFGREAVAVFFVLSGYLVGGQVVRQVRQDRFNPRVFVIKRLSRFWIVLLPGLLFTAVLDTISRSQFTTDNPFVQGRATSGFPAALGNAVFLMDGRCLAFGTNHSLWSLGYEFWFYFVFAALCVAASALVRRRWGAAIAGVVIAAACVAAFGLHLLWLIPAWLIGVLVAELQPRCTPWVMTQPRRRIIGAAVAVCVAGLLVSTFYDTPLRVKYLFLGCTTAPLVGALAILDPQAPSWARSAERVGVWLGTWSFTLYVFHLPFVMLVTAAADAAGIVPTPLFVYALTLITVAAVYPTYWLGEAHTAKVRSWALRVTSRSRTPA